MSTSIANLSLTEYVKVNSLRARVFIQAHRDSVRYVLSDVKPARNNPAYHTLSGADESILLDLDTDLWVLAVTGNSGFTITEFNIQNFSDKLPDETDETDDYFFYGWENIRGSWVIQRQNRIDASSLTALTTGYTDLESAWLNRETLVYN